MASRRRGNCPPSAGPGDLSCGTAADSRRRDGKRGEILREEWSFNRSAGAARLWLWHRRGSLAVRVCSASPPDG
jgi:hypothetical protein